MTSRPIDQNALNVPQLSGLPLCLYVPIAARDESAIEKYVGKISSRLSPRSRDKAFLVEAHIPEKADDRLGIWDLPTATVLHYTRQVWVHVDYSGYRRAYIRAFPDVDLTGFVLDHVMNRRVARLMDFMYLRIVPVSRVANSSHGGLSERWAADYQGLPRMRKLNKASKAVVQYADLSDIVKMLNMEGGGSRMELVSKKPRSKLRGIEKQSLKDLIGVDRHAEV